MTNKKGLFRKFGLGLCYIFSCIWLIYTSIKFLLGKASIEETIGIMICLCVLGYLLISIISIKIKNKYLDCKIYKNLMYLFKYLQDLHFMRYKLYFTGNKKEIEKYSILIKQCGNNILDVGNLAISEKWLNSKQQEDIENILMQTKKLMIND